MEVGGAGIHDGGMHELSQIRRRVWEVMPEEEDGNFHLGQYSSDRKETGKQAVC